MTSRLTDGFIPSRDICFCIPRTELPSHIGYAEAINAGKSKFNEDQATVVEGELTCSNGVRRIPYLYVGLFDGHGGTGCAVKVSRELHNILHEGRSR